MPATKRKASFTGSDERPYKMSKRRSSRIVSGTLSSLSKNVSVVLPPSKLPKFPSLRARKSDAATTVTALAQLPEVGGSPTPPALRRASTLTLEDDSKSGSAKTTLTKRKSSASKPSSLSKKSSSFVEKGALVTKLTGLRSGSIVGETSLAASTLLSKKPSVRKSLSRKSTSVKFTRSSSKIPTLPSGLTRLSLPRRGSKSGSLHNSKSILVSDIDETEMSSALESLKTHLSKEGSKKRSVSKSASIRSTSSLKKTGDNKGEDMDTSTASTSDDRGAGFPSDGLMEVAISFDTTGSMYECLEEVKAKVQDLVQRLQADIPGIRVAVIAHGDYCDESNYVIKWIDFGATLPEICNFVKNVGRTSGGDGPECYELVLQRSREVLSWTEGSKRILVMISDDVPHEPGYTYGGISYHINWRDECAALKEMGVKVYGVQAGYGLAAAHFNEEMARITGGKRLSLRNFSCIFDVLMMICYREGNPEMLAIYEQEIIDRGERIPEDITSLKKTFDMAPTVFPPHAMMPLMPAFPSHARMPLMPAFPSHARMPLMPAFPSHTRMPLMPAFPPHAKMPLMPAFPPNAKNPIMPAFPPFSKIPFNTAFPAFPKIPQNTGFPFNAKMPLMTAFPAHAKKSLGIGKLGKAGTAGAKRAGKTLKTQAKNTNLKKQTKKVETVKKREKLPDSCMNKATLKTLTWSKWINAVEPKMPTNKQKSNYVKLRTNQGFGPKTIFDGNFKVPAIYEVAVHMPGSRKKYVVYSKVAKGGIRRSGQWATIILHHKKVRQEVNNVLNQGCSIYIRRGIPEASNADENKSQMLAANAYIRDNFDYAWKKYIWRKSKDGESKFGLKHRFLEMPGKGKTFTLSDNKL